MGSVYARLLQVLERKRFDVFGPQPVRLSRATKILLTLRNLGSAQLGRSLAEWPYQPGFRHIPFWQDS